MSGSYNAFISYGRADSKAFATQLHKRLLSEGLKVWFDQNDIPLGVDFQNQIDEGIETSHNFLFIIAPHSVNSPYCRKEIELALKRNKRIIPLLHVEEISQETWQQRNPNGTEADWETYKAKGLHSSFPNMHPAIGKINWVYFREGMDDFDTAFAGLVELLQRNQDYVEQHTQFLVNALAWERNQKQTKYLLIGEERQQAEAWLKIRFNDEQPPCVPTNLHCEFITESIKNANNLMTQVFLAYAEADKGVMQQIRNRLWREGFTVWTNQTDIQTGEVFQEAIHRGIEAADNLVYLLSPDSVTSEYCQQEVDYALSLNKRIIPIKVGVFANEKIPSVLRDLQYIDLTDNIQDEDYHLDESQLVRILYQDATYYHEHKLLLTKALKWERQHRNPSILLRGYNLRQGEAWLKVAEQRNQHPPIPLIAEFISESLRQPPGLSLDVFISYSRSDSDFARKLNEALQIQGKTTWFDQESIASGADFQQEIYRGIENSDNFLFILSPRAVNSPYCADEVEYAAKLNKRFVTVLHIPVNLAELHPELAKVQWIDFNQNQREFNANFNQLVRTLETDRDHVHNHTKWSQRALEWEKKGKSEDLLLRGNEFAIAETWLIEAEEQKKQPKPTALQTQYIQASQAAIQAGIVKEKRRVMILRSLLGLVSAAFVVSVGAGVVAFSQYHKAEYLRRIAEKEKLIALSNASEALFISDQKFQALLAALKAGTTLKFTNGKLGEPQIKADIMTALQQAIYWVRERNQLEGHTEQLWHVTFSPDGKIIATASQDGTVKLWNPEGEELQTLKGHEGTVFAVRFSPDGQMLATAGGDKTVKLWTVEGQLKQTLIGHSAAVRDVKFTPDGQRIISGSEDQTVKLWTTDGQLRQTLTDHRDRINRIAVSPNGQHFATASDDKTVNLWTIEGQLRQTFTGHTGAVWGVSFSPDGKTIATASNDKTVKLWNQDGTLFKTLTGHTDGVLTVSFSPNGERIASGGYDQTVKLWNRDGNLVDTLSGHTNLISSLSFSPDSQTLASASFDHSAKLWQVAGVGLQTLSGHDNWIFSLAFSPDGKRLATASRDNTVKLWTRTGQLITTLKQHQEAVWSVNFSPDGQTLATASNDRTAKLWNPQGNLLKTLIGHQRGVLGVSFSPDGQTIATASDDQTAKLWTIDGEEQQTLKGHKGTVNQVRFSPDGQTIATASSDQTVKLWHRQGTLLNTLTGHSGVVVDVNFSPDGQTIATASRDSTAKLWERQGNLLTTLIGHGDDVQAIAFSPGGQMIATASNDQTVKLWTIEGKLVQTLTGIGGAVMDVQFSPDGQTLASASTNHQAILWDLDYVGDLDELLVRGCDFVRGYLEHNPNVKPSDRDLCDKFER
ncbi:TIR domain-containing protein [Coleofasciculus chthonoplastes]|jgi:WD40 repeat protein|uniref:TIR domain-containing protein n=1 Tax=Coleofasciculus chthonoplastes TaxID=64178 RepID=UPI0032F75AFE